MCGLGSPVSEISRANDRDLNFYLVGAMGSAAAVRLGLALAQPDRTVIVITGDGELMMNVGILATIGVIKPRNLSIIVMDNERFGETGQQMSHTAFGVDIAGDRARERLCRSADRPRTAHAAERRAAHARRGGSLSRADQGRARFRADEHPAEGRRAGQRPFPPRAARGNE